MVPKLIIGLGGTPFSSQTAWGLCKAVFDAWDFEAHYVPAELEERGVGGLPPTTYPFAHTARAVWEATHTYVEDVVRKASIATGGETGGDGALVARDERLAAWVAQLRDPLWMPSFPDIRTDAELVDA